MKTIEEIKEMDFSDWAGKEIEWSNSYASATGILVEIDYDIGLTIVNKDNKNEYLACTIGPTGYKKVCQLEYGPDQWDEYHAILPIIVDMLEHGYFDQERIRVYSSNVGSASASTCPFV